MVFEVRGDSGGVKDAEFQFHLADQMVAALPRSGSQAAGLTNEFATADPDLRPNRSDTKAKVRASSCVSF